MNGPGGIVRPGPSRLGSARYAGVGYPPWSSSIVARLVGLRRNLAYFRTPFLKQRRQRIKEESQALPQSSIVIEAGNADNAPLAEEEPAGDVILEYCAVVRGILNDDQGGPLHPPGLRMAEALGEVRDSIQRNLDEKKGHGSNPRLFR